MVAEDNSRLSGVGLLHNSGEIRLFYLTPETQRQGIGKAMHAALEEKAIAWGLHKLHLESTARARPFYAALGYQPVGAATLRFGVLQSYPYAKTLEPLRHE